MRVCYSALLLLLGLSAGADAYSTKSGVKPWVDVNTSTDVYTIKTSRGDTWDLVMSDEFNVAGRDFTPGSDYLWTALEMPDGVNSALEYYSINMTSTVTESDGRGVFQIETREEDNITYTVYNAYTHPAGYITSSMYYRSGMVQSWNKFCMQGGRIEVKLQLPGAVASNSTNPDIYNGTSYRATTIAYYPTWPGVWLMGNLGRALFTTSTSRMWPWSFDTCDEDLSQDQRINACDDSPGYGLNANQGRGAPEIDILEGGGTAISTSVQIAPGMPTDFRVISPTNDTNEYCIYSRDCDTVGANVPGVPTATYKARGHNSWYQGLRYAPNTGCMVETSEIQNATLVNASIKAGVTSNTCEGTNTCPASMDGYSALGPIDGTSKHHWGVNEQGACMPVMNAYTGAFLCDPDNNNTECTDPYDGSSPTDLFTSFAYQMDAISANSGIFMAAYMDYVLYQLEWVMGSEGYIRWMVEDVVIFEIPADALVNPPEDSASSNPKKIMIEEPMYLIFNVALSSSWGSTPPNVGEPCKGTGSGSVSEETEGICDSFPMYMKIDYIRVYQDTSASSNMSIGCDPSTHPTKEWIEGHIDEYESTDNEWIEVIGGAPCYSSDDCTVDIPSVASLITGQCTNGVCECLSPTSWAGPRCIDAVASTSETFGPSITVSAIVGGVIFVIFIAVVAKLVHSRSSKQIHEGMAAAKAARADNMEQELEDMSLSASAPQSGDKVV